MINEELRKYSPEQLFSRSQEAYGRAYRRGEVPSWSKHPLPGLTAEFVTGLRGISATPKVLDIGCGDGNKSVHLAQLGLTVVGVDHEDPAIRLASRHLQENAGSDLRFIQGDARKLDLLFGQNEFDGIFDYQCLASIPPEFWKDIARSYHTVIKPGGLLLIDLLNLESPEFYGDVSEKMGGSHEYAFEFDEGNPQHAGLDWEDGLYVYFFDERETTAVFGEHFKLEVLEKRLHPYHEKRVLWSALMRSNK